MYSFALSLGTVMKVFLSNLETLKACTEEDLEETVKRLLEQGTCKTNFELKTW